MNCQRCNLSQVTKKCIVNINGKKDEKYLCDNCYTEVYGQFFDVQENFFSSFFNSSNAFVKKPREKVCKSCGTELSSFTKTGIVGCVDCYTTFKDEIKPMIQRLHGKMEHIGKAPKRLTELYELTEEKKKLALELERARENNDLEEANKLNLEIIKITQHLNKLTERGDGK